MLQGDTEGKYNVFFFVFLLFELCSTFINSFKKLGVFFIDFKIQNIPPCNRLHVLTSLPPPPLTSQNDWHSSPSSRRGSGGHILPCSVTQQTDGAAVLSILALDQLFAPFAKFTHGSWAWNMDFSTSFAGGKFSHCDMITWQRDKNSW